ncbi:MAG TPA: NAD(P)/FAD-dependent oxidoreductase [Stellaceae bacterium]|nr:NAD(P)/FAD-dependent oxidoreductase [Stellaceae bacterium]
MASRQLTDFLVIGAGAAGLMTARELARASKRVVIIEARDRCGGRIEPLPVEQFGYPAEAGAEFVHGAAPVTRALMREAGISLSRRGGTRWSTRTGAWRPADPTLPDADRFNRALRAVEADLPIARFLETHFAGPQYDVLRRSITRTVEGYDAADPQRLSTLAFREEWLARDDGEHGRVSGGYGALIDYLAAECRRHGAALHHGAAVVALDRAGDRVTARCHDGASFTAQAAVLAVPLPMLGRIALPPAAREQAAASADIGFGNVVKFLLRFATQWWRDAVGQDPGQNLDDLSFVISDARVPTWWTQYPAAHPVLTGWFAGPKADTVAALGEPALIDMGLASLAEIFARPVEHLRALLVAARAVNWGNDPFARGAYSYATPRTRTAQLRLRQSNDEAIFFAGEALYAGPDMGTVEAALANGRDTVQAILAAA